MAEGIPATTTRRRGSGALRALLRQREFRSFLVANTSERLAASALVVLLGFQVFETRHRALDLGWLGLVEAIPSVTLVLYGGHVADTHSRRGIVILTSGLLALLSFCLALLPGEAPLRALFSLYGIALLAAALRALESPAADGLEAQVVPREHVLQGVPFLASIARIGDVAGPALGGLAWSAFGPGGTYFGIGLLFALTSITLILGVGEKPIAHPDARDTAVWQRVAEGAVFVFRDQLLLGSMALDLFAVFFGGAEALLPIFATQILHVGAGGFGLLRAAGALGSLAAAIAATRFLPRRYAGRMLLLTVGGFGVSIIVFGLSRNVVLSFAALFAAGMCDGLNMMIRRAILRLSSPDVLRGRIAAVKAVFVGSSNELGAFESGIAASALGAAPAVWAGGLVTLCVVAATAWLAPRLRNLDLLALARSGGDGT
jgi:Transmembrane secretion effector